VEWGRGSVGKTDVDVEKGRKGPVKWSIELVGKGRGRNRRND
jgi:hypothetical protein